MTDHEIYEFVEGHFICLACGETDLSGTCQADELLELDLSGIILPLLEQLSKISDETLTGLGLYPAYEYERQLKGLSRYLKVSAIKHLRFSARNITG